MTDLQSAPVPELREDDHVRGPEDAPLVVLYADFTCAVCALAWSRLRDADDLRVVFRHFAVKARSPRAVPTALAAEAAAGQGAFWPMHDALYADQGRHEDPHLWALAERLGLDVERFEADRRGEEALARVRRDVREGLAGGVAATPTAFTTASGSLLALGYPGVVRNKENE
jgi:protein-disulfide isomerase